MPDRGRLSGAESKEPPKPIVPVISGSDVAQEGRRGRTGRLIDSGDGRAASLESIGRSLSRRKIHGRSRAVALAHDHDEAVKGLRAIAEASRARWCSLRRRTWSLTARSGAGRFRRSNRKHGQGPLPATRSSRSGSTASTRTSRRARLPVVELISDDAIDHQTSPASTAIEVVQTGDLRHPDRPVS